MDFQYYDTLMDKSVRKLNYFIENITPNFMKGEMPVLLDDLAGKPNKNSIKTSIATDFIEIGKDYNTYADLSKLSSEQLKQIYQIFISNELNDKPAIKWRFYQYLKFTRDFVIENVYINRSGNQNDMVDFIIETDNSEIVFVVCYTILELESYMEIINDIIEFTKKNNLLPDKIIIATQKTYRNIPINEEVTIQGKSIIAELWVEWVEINKSFNGDDLIIISSSNTDENIEIAGYNFTSTEDVLNYVYEYSDGGQILIFKQNSFFSESDLSKEQKQVELIWKGLMIKEF
jgi:hypothetical protein